MVAGAADTVSGMVSLPAGPLALPSTALPQAVQRTEMLNASDISFLLAFLFMFPSISVRLLARVMLLIYSL